MLTALATLLALLMTFSLASLVLGWRSRRVRQEQIKQLLERVGIGHHLQAEQTHKRAGRLAGRSLGVRGKRLLAITAALLLLDLIVFMGPLRPEAPLSLLLLALPLLPAALEWRRHFLRRRAFAQQFPDALEAMVRGLSAGHTIDEVLRMIANEFPAPLGEEFRQSNQHVQVGVPLGEALRELEQRVPLPELRYFVLTLLVQRESGGQLAGILSELARLLRRRAMFQGRLRALTAESRFTAWFVGGAPLIYLFYKLLFQRSEMAFFLYDSTGQALLRVSIVLIVCGALLLRWMMRIRF